MSDALYIKLLDSVEGWIIVDNIIGLPFNFLEVSNVLYSLDALILNNTELPVIFVIFGIWHDSKTHLALCDNLTSFNELCNENLIILELVKNPLTEADAPDPITAVTLAPPIDYNNYNINMPIRNYWNNIISYNNNNV